MNDDDARDPDRAAILARRQRFIALALTGLSTGLSTAGCKHTEPQPCLSMVVPDEPEQPPGTEPIVEHDGAPVDTANPEPEPTQPAPEPCLKVAAPR